VTLTDAQIERYSRQIVLPEVGGRGQERLLAARVVLAGEGPVARAAADLLVRAGIGAVVADDAPAPTPDVIVDLSGDLRRTHALGRRAQAAGRPFVAGLLGGTRLTVATLVGRPCITCFSPEDAGAAGGGPLAAPATLALAALTATEVLRLLVLPTADGRATALDLATGAATATKLTPTRGCALCGGCA